MTAVESSNGVVPAPIFWLTGLSGAGKTTLARLLVARIRGTGSACLFLDGDELRELWPTAGGFTRAERVPLALAYARLCGMVSRNGICAVIATISLYREVHQWLAAHLPQCRVIFVDVPVPELQRRDPKGIYARFAIGELTNVAGLDLEVDYPENPWFHLRWQAGLTPEDALEDLWPVVRGEVSFIKESDRGLDVF